MIDKDRFSQIKPLHDKLDREDDDIAQDEIIQYAKNLSTREILFDLLIEYDRAELFPKEFYTIEKGAEAHLAYWLDFPTELDSCPDELKLVKKVIIERENQNMCYYVFKFRVFEPHWAAKDGWMLGVVGPYFDNSEPYDFATATYSRFKRLATISPEKEAKWVHENIELKSKSK